MRLSLVPLAGALLLGAFGCARETVTVEGMNVLLVTLNSTRVDSLSCYGHGGGISPNLDALAAKGVRFDRAISTAGLTPMAHASILTGRNPYAHGLRVFHGDLDHRLPADVPVLPELLADRGWRTAAFVSAYPVSGAFGLDRGYQRFDTGLEQGFAQPIRNETRLVDARVVDARVVDARVVDARVVDARVGRSQRRGDATTDAALTWLEEYGELGPWHLWIHYFDPHDVSLVPPASFAKAHGIEYDPDAPRGDARARERLYELEVRWMDRQIGRVFEWLRRSGQYENTVIVVIADHGQGLSDDLARHGWSKHRLLHDWSIHVPLLLYVPELPSEGQVEELVRSIDLLPTVLEALDIPLPGGVEGRSLLPLLRGELDEPRFAYADALNTHDTHAPLSRLPETQRDDLYAVVDRGWKLIHHRGAPEASELYDLANDPQELKNVFAEFPEEVARLRRFLERNDAFRLITADAAAPGPDAGALGDLGYVGDGEDGAKKEKRKP